jgi:hypothetical protein
VKTTVTHRGFASEPMNIHSYTSVHLQFTYGSRGIAATRFGERLHTRFLSDNNGGPGRWTTDPQVHAVFRLLTLFNAPGEVNDRHKDRPVGHE